ncbi:ATP-dependent Clp protease proteolytic subunit [Halioglobus japonicus]|nr:ATP-dependent Clp protease proteolytic subunit [Halioglobus japonicus]
MTAPAKGTNWYGINAAANGSIAISIFDEIGAWGTSAASFIQELNSHADVTEINLSIHSPGGSVWEGLAIYNALVEHPATVNVYIAGLAASMASAIAMAGDSITIPEDAFMMVHCPRGGATGKAGDMREYADLLDQAEETLTNIYAKRTGLPRDEIGGLLAGETWMPGSECVAKGFADKLAEPVKMAATANPDSFGVFAALPDSAKNLIGKVEPSAEAKQIKALLADKARREEIAAALKGHEDNPQIAALISDGTFENISSNEASELIMTAIGSTKTPSAAQIHVGNGAIVRDVITDALQARAHLGQLQDKGNPYQAASLLDMARASLIQNGVGIAAMAPMQVVAAAFTHGSGDFGFVLADVAEKAMLKGWQEAGETFQKWTVKGSVSSFRPAHRAAISDYPALPVVREGAEFTHATIDNSGETIALATYGSLFGITRQAIINDDLSAFDRIPRAQGIAAMRTIGDLVYAVLAANAAMGDGVSLFHANHGNTSTDALDVAGLSAARKAMRLQTDANGQALNIGAKYLIVPAALETQAETVLKSTSIASETNSGIANPVGNMAEIITESRLDANDADTWYLAAEGETIEVAYLHGVDAPYLEQQQGFTVDGVAFKVRIDAGVAPLDHRGMYRATGGMPS